jgi:hypothetical protein
MWVSAGHPPDKGKSCQHGASLKIQVARSQQIGNISGTADDSCGNISGFLPEFRQVERQLHDASYVSQKKTHQAPHPDRHA